MKKSLERVVVCVSVFNAPLCVCLSLLTGPRLELGARIRLDDVRRHNANVETHNQPERERLALLSGGQRKKKDEGRE